MTASCPVHNHAAGATVATTALKVGQHQKRNPCKRSEKGKPTTKAGCRGRQGSCFCRLRLIHSVVLSEHLLHMNHDDKMRRQDIWTGDFSDGSDRTPRSIRDISRVKNATRIHPWSCGAVDKSQFFPRHNTTAHGPCFVSVPISGGLTTSPDGHGPHPQVKMDWSSLFHLVTSNPLQVPPR